MKLTAFYQLTAGGRGCRVVSKYHYMNTETIQTTIRLPEKLHQQAKIHAINEKMSLNDLLVAALHTALAKKARAVR